MISFCYFNHPSSIYYFLLSFLASQLIPFLFSTFFFPSSSFLPSFLLSFLSPLFCISRFCSPPNHSNTNPSLSPALTFSLSYLPTSHRLPLTSTTAFPLLPSSHSSSPRSLLFPFIIISSFSSSSLYSLAFLIIVPFSHYHFLFLFCFLLLMSQTVLLHLIFNCFCHFLFTLVFSAPSLFILYFLLVLL